MSQPQPQPAEELLLLPPPIITGSGSSQQPEQPEQPENPQHPENPSSSSSSSSSRPSSAGSASKRPAPEDDISELVRKAKASRYAQSARKSDDDGLADDLERDLSCAICSEVLNNPVACAGCMHSFCGSCLVPWLERTNTCPTCRRVVKEISDNHIAISLVETLYTRFPDKRRDPEELKELEKVYKPGQRVYIEDADPNDDDDDDRQSDNEDEEEDDHIAWPPCPCCVPGNPYGFTCLDPIPAADPPHMADVYYYRNHVHCPDCPNTIPITWKPGYKCESCGTINCGALFPCATPGLLDRPSAHVRAIAPPNAAFRENAVELGHFESWRTRTGTSYEQIARHVYDWLARTHGGQFPTPRRPVPLDAFVCRMCVAGVLQERFIDWWCAEKVAHCMDVRPRCWYGWRCRTQFHNPAHAEKLLHCCAEVPEAQRVRAGGRGGGGGGGRLDIAGVVGPVVDFGVGQPVAGQGQGQDQQGQQ